MNDDYAQALRRVTTCPIPVIRAGSRPRCRAAETNDKYGAKDKTIRFRHRLAEAVASVAYAGLDLAHLNEPSSGAGLTRAYKMGP